MYIIKCKDLSYTAPAGFPAHRLDDRWHPFVIEYDSLAAALQAVKKQQAAPKKRPQPVRLYRIFQKEGRHLNLVWEG